MPFNSNSYYANKNRRQALQALASARAEPNRATYYVTLARLYWRSFLTYRSVQRCDADMKRCRRGEMTYAAFIEKWHA